MTEMVREALNKIAFAILFFILVFVTLPVLNEVHLWLSRR